LERAKGIEPSYAAWEAAVLPLNYARGVKLFSITGQPCKFPCSISVNFRPFAPVCTYATVASGCSATPAGLKFWNDRNHAFATQFHLGFRLPL
jgi:hypothetical protein